MIHIFIVDDHHIFRDGLKLLFADIEDMEVVGEAPSGKVALEKLGQLGSKPDLILMDIQMPEQNGIEVTRDLKKLYPDLKVLMLTMFDDDQSVFAAMRAGALGYVLKGVRHEEMLQAVRVAAEGGAIFSPQIASYVLNWFSQNSGLSSEKPAVELPDLTQREQEVLQLLAAGSDNQTIAETLTVTEKTVRNYVSALLKKLEVDSRTEAGEKGRQAGLL